MILLTSTSDLIQIVTSAAVATHVQASFIDLDGTTVTTGRTNTIVSTATTTPAVGSPTGTNKRNVKHISVRAVGGAQTVTLQHTDGSTVVEVYKAALLTGESVVFTDGLGFQTLNSAGAVKVDQGGLGNFLGQTLLTAASGNFTTQANTKKIVVRMVGGGGGGGGCSSVASAAASAGGGGSGGFAKKVFDVAGSTAYAYTCGAAGAGNSGAAGGNGGNSTFVVGATTVTANGGTGGYLATAATSLTSGRGGAGGAVSTNGDVNSGGAPGTNGYVLIVTGAIGGSGCGGSCEFGGGGSSIIAAGAGVAATGYGGGGGGAHTAASSARAGGAGTGGCIVVEEYA